MMLLKPLSSVMKILDQTRGRERKSKFCFESYFREKYDWTTAAAAAETQSK